MSLNSKIGLEIMNQSLKEFSRSFNIISPKREDIIDNILDDIYNINLIISHDTSKTQYGFCRYKDRTIVVYSHPHNDDLSEFEDTIRHELAHHIIHILHPESLYKNSNIKPHGKEWKAVATILGARPKATHCMIDTDIPTDVEYIAVEFNYNQGR